jgi:two-component system, NtrC family, sensor kinase
MRNLAAELSPVHEQMLLEMIQRLTRERDQLRSDLDLRNCALDSAASHFMIVDATRRQTPIVYVNETLAKEHGYAREELIGADPGILLPPELNPSEQKRIAAAIRAGEALKIEVRCRRRDGSVFWAGIFLGPVRDSTGRVTHYVSIAADITGRMQEEENKRLLQEQLVSEMQERESMGLKLRLAQKLESVGQLAAGIAHEINTPIQYVGDSITFLQQAVGDCRALLESYQEALRRIVQGGSATQELEQLRQTEHSLDLPFLREEVPKAFDRTLEGVGRVAQIVRAMKEFAHHDQVEQNPADINHAIETTLTVARNEYKYVASIELEFAQLPEVLCNVGELNQVFLNLIVNAAHAIAAAGKDVSTGRIAISTALSDASVVVAIEDNGCGIPEKNMERIFDPFFTTKEVGRGTGQGLAIARSIIVEKHSGAIDVHSTVGIGTRFVITLPLAGRAAGRAS